MKTDTLLDHLDASSAHQDVIEYVLLSQKTTLGENFVATLRDFAKHESLERIPDIGNPVEQELWSNGVKRLVLHPLQEPYEATPDTEQKRILELIYERRYQPY